MAFLDYYEILSVPPTATLEQIERAYKRLVSISHPDLFGSDAHSQAWATERMKQIHEAYDVLRNPHKRADYDRKYAVWKPQQARGQQARREQAESWVRCPLCEGQGRTTCLVCQGHGDDFCPGCSGERSITCPSCGGSGSVREGDYGRLREEVERAARQARARQEEEAQRQRAAELTRLAAERQRRQVVGGVVGIVLFLLLARGCIVGGSHGRTVYAPSRRSRSSHPTGSDSASTTP